MIPLLLAGVSFGFVSIYALEEEACLLGELGVNHSNTDLIAYTCLWEITLNKLRLTTAHEETF